MKFYGEFVGASLNIRAYIAAASEYLEDKLKEGARIWLTNVTGRVPIWTGMARASLIDISRLVNGRVVLAPLKAKSRIPQGESMGSARIITDFPYFAFEVSTLVPHYVLQEFKNVRHLTGRGSPSAPWFSFAAGQAAFFEFARTVQLPPVVYDSITVKRL